MSETRNRNPLIFKWMAVKIKISSNLTPNDKEELKMGSSTAQKMWQRGKAGGRLEEDGDGWDQEAESFRHATGLGEPFLPCWPQVSWNHLSLTSNWFKQSSHFPKGWNCLYLYTLLLVPENKVGNKDLQWLKLLFLASGCGSLVIGTLPGEVCSIPRRDTTSH